MRRRIVLPAFLLAVALTLSAPLFSSPGSAAFEGEYEHYSCAEEWEPDTTVCASRKLRAGLQRIDTL